MFCAASCDGRNAIAGGVENGDPASRGQMTAAKSDIEDRSENPQSAVN